MRERKRLTNHEGEAERERQKLDRESAVSRRRWMASMKQRDRLRKLKEKGLPDLIDAIHLAEAAWRIEFELNGAIARVYNRLNTERLEEEGKA